MVRINKHDWRIERQAKRRGMWRRGLMMAAAVAVAVTSFAMFPFQNTPTASAVGTYGPDPADYSFGNDTVYLVVSATSNVRITDTYVKLYYASSGNPTDITIEHADLCASASQYYDSGVALAGATGTIDTRFELVRAVGGGNGPSGTVIRSVNGITQKGATCSNRNLQVNAADLTYEPDIGQYVVYVRARKIQNAAQNAFRIHAPGGTVGFVGKQDAQQFGLEPLDDNAYGRADVKFAPDCSFKTTSWEKLEWYDFDQNIPNVQPNDMTFQVLEDGNPLPQSSFRNPKAAFLSGGTAADARWKPSDNPTQYNKQYGSVEFIAKPGKKYIWRLLNVYENNTIQLTIPFDSIYYNEDCRQYQITPGITGPAAGTFLIPGNTYNFNATAKNVGDPTDPFTMKISENASQLPSGNGSVSETPTQWSNLTLGRNASLSKPFTATVAANAPNNSWFCINNTVDPSNVDGDPKTSPDSCWQIKRPGYPGVIGTASDIHAGGGLCSAAGTTPGAIQLSLESKSYGEYVVSSNRAVNNLGSNATPGNTAAGIQNYNSICRPDLLANARAAINAGSVGYTAVSGTFNLTGKPAGVYVHNGGTLNVSGTATNQITIVSLAGTVNISGKIILAAPSLDGRQAPSVGIMAAGNIDIAPAATQVDAYLFADGTITTCTGNVQSACANTLIVNGFLMSKAIAFRRLGPAAGFDATIGEQVNMTGMLYLNPPKFFDDAADVNLLQNQGERPPLN
jgi:hypothetical protein